MRSKNLFERCEQSMLVIYDKNSKKIIPLSETNFSAHNILERRISKNGLRIVQIFWEKNY